MADEDLRPRGLTSWWRGDRLVLTRFAVLRLLGVVYFFAFLSLARQVLPLIGHDGLLPADAFLERVRPLGFWKVPTIFWFGISDTLLEVLAWTGVVLAALVALGFANSILMLVLWALYLSFVHIGQLWYGYGWEIQLCETGFLAIFLAPLVDPRPFSPRAPPAVILWLFRWLAVRIMLGAGLIKLRGAACWHDLTCLDHHFETQPIPNPLSAYLHFAPLWVHHAGVVFNHVCELFLPVFLFAPRRVRHLAALPLVGFQLFLISSGNLSFLNWLTIVPILAAFDDGAWRRVLPRRLVAAAARVTLPPTRAARVTAIALACGVGLLSVNVVENLLSPAQEMNRSYDPFDLVNTYGAFGSVGETRNEVVFEGTADGTTWKEYEFPCKPGDPARRPCIVSPYQPRLDWQIWFAAMGGPDDAPWTVHLVWKLLHNDRRVLGLLGNDPFPDAPPLQIRARLYAYRFAPLGAKAWWQREFVEEWLPPLGVDDPRLRRFLGAHGWLDDH